MELYYLITLVNSAT